MTRLPPAVVRVRELEAEQGRWRAERPALALRTTVLDLLTSCGLQYYADHSIGDDIRLLDRAVHLLGDQSQRRLTGDFEGRCLRAVGVLDTETADLRRRVGDLDAEDLLRVRVVEIPTQTVLGRVDEEAPADLVCWNETNCLLEGVSLPYRCAAAVATLAHFGVPDRYRIVDHMVALRARYEREWPDRPALDAEILEAAREYVAPPGSECEGSVVQE